MECLHSYFYPSASEELRLKGTLKGSGYLWPLSSVVDLVRKLYFAICVALHQHMYESMEPVVGLTRGAKSRWDLAPYFAVSCENHLEDR